MMPEPQRVWIIQTTEAISVRRRSVPLKQSGMTLLAGEVEGRGYRDSPQ